MFDELFELFDEDEKNIGFVSLIHGIGFTFMTTHLLTIVAKSVIQKKKLLNFLN